MPRPSQARKLVARLVGMETEYATLVADQQDLENEDLPPSKMVFDQICEAIRRDQPTVGGLFDNEQMFLASGGAVTFESHPSMHSLPGGLIEIATPEVHSPSDLLACQRSIDSLVSESTADSETGFDLRVLKNSSDALGHVYGCHENYEATVASGLFLILYRMFIALLWVMQIFSLVLSLPWLGILLVLVWLCKKIRRTGGQLTEPQDMFDTIPKWLSTILVGGMRIIHIPTVFVLRFVASQIAFRRQRKYLTAFLVSRVALCGTGVLDHSGRFQMSAKAMAIDKVADLGGFRGERPMYVFGHWLSQFCSKSFTSLASTRQMFRRSQRLQIGLSDSNMSDLAEYVKVGSTSLLLDLIESDNCTDLPILKRPISSLHDLASDWNLITSIPTQRGKRTAIEIQEIYYRAAEKFVARAPAETRGEAPLVLQRWRELLDAAIAFRRDAADVEPAIGRIDWLSKQWLMSELGDSVDWTARKKVDLRYHELSDEGYFQQLMIARPERRLVDQEQIDRRRRSPPADSPAAKRGWMIREFADSDQLMKSEWTHAIIGKGRKRRRVEFVDQSTTIK
ncbi:MAG: proteasome accessory factor PafA2 family protein [Rubripirellula sp.]|nr:proteasome accessory factor PafA2 family protein [Rubripirellula sp.]